MALETQNMDAVKCLFAKGADMYTAKDKTW
jgi:hypothetical protein